MLVFAVDTGGIGEVFTVKAFPCARAGINRSPYNVDEPLNMP